MITDVHLYEELISALFLCLIRMLCEQASPFRCRVPHTQQVHNPSSRPINLAFPTTAAASPTETQKIVTVFFFLPKWLITSTVHTERKTRLKWKLCDLETESSCGVSCPILFLSHVGIFLSFPIRQFGVFVFPSLRAIQIQLERRRGGETTFPIVVVRFSMFFAEVRSVHTTTSALHTNSNPTRHSPIISMMKFNPKCIRVMVILKLAMDNPPWLKRNTFIRENTIELFH